MPASLATATAAAVSEDDRSLLVLVLETNPVAWATQLGDQTTVVESTMNQLLLFLNAFLAMREDNLVAVFAAHHARSVLVFANGPEGTVEAERTLSDVAAAELRGKYEQFATLDRIVARDLKALVETAGRPPPGNTSSALSACLSSALCYINRVLRNDQLSDVKPRVLVVNVCPDAPVQFIPIMNCLFSAQKLSIPVDVCSLTVTESIFMQQAAHLTGGLFVRSASLATFLPTLLSAFLPDRHTRKLLVLPQKHDVDFRASCFCHKRLIDIGYVCSVCLSIFCKRDMLACTTCNTKFETVAPVRSDA